MGFVIPLWLKIVGPIAALLILIGGITAWSHHQYNKGHKAGVEETDAQWKAAAEKLKEQAAQSATQADDRAAARLEEQRQDAAEDRKAVEDAKAKNSSPLDALFGGD